MKKIILIILIIFLNINVKALGQVKLLKCIDGDTAKFLYNEKEITVRFLAIDTPELKKNERYAREAMLFTCDSLKKAQSISLIEDEKVGKDKYGRYLAWVFVDGKLLQDELIKRGYAKNAYLYGKYKYIDQLKISEKKAMEEKKGIWQYKISTQKPKIKVKFKNNKEKNIFNKIINDINKILKLMIKLINQIVSLLTWF